MLRFTAAFGFLALSATLWAKGDTVLIEVTGGGLTSTLSITDPQIENFTPWAGPGVNHTTLADGVGFIIDWQKGIAPQPASLQHYEVSFYAGCRVNRHVNDPKCAAEKQRLVYVVNYDYDPAAKRGFVYLPDCKAEPNCGTIFHGRGVEGNWFVATDAWDKFVGPLIAAGTR